MLLCERCNRGFHTFCVGLRALPEEDRWFCHDCVRTRAHAGAIAVLLTAAGIPPVPVLPIVRPEPVHVSSAAAGAHPRKGYLTLSRVTSHWFVCDDPSVVLFQSRR